MKILVINPGSTSTKVAVYEYTKNVFLTNILHSFDEVLKFDKVVEQCEFRKQKVLEVLSSEGFNLKEFNIVISRGGLLKPLESGVYHVNDNMIRDIKAPMAEHISNIGGYIAKEIADIIGNNVEAFVVDPSCVDEFDDIARLSGLPELPRKSFLHTLNQKAVARKYATEYLKKYEDMNLIVVHMGSGITVGAHQKGRIIDVNNGLDGDGPFAAERAGTLPAGQLVDLCFSGKYTRSEIRKLLTGYGGMQAYLGTCDAIEVEKMIQQGNKKAELVYSAMAYQVAQSIGAMATVLKGDVEAILLTGGLAHGKIFTDMIIERVSFISKVLIYPGEDEVYALAMNGLMILKNEIKAKEY
ncbi:MAG: butyrate kinase [Bacteroidetes bacterium]|nr:butyrate kinase [Bacteroidota bacterium]